MLVIENNDSERLFIKHRMMENINDDILVPIVSKFNTFLSIPFRKNIVIPMSNGIKIDINTKNIDTSYIIIDKPISIILIKEGRVPNMMLRTTNKEMEIKENKLHFNE